MSLFNHSISRAIASLLALLLLAPSFAMAGSYDDYFTAVKLDAPRELQQMIARGLGPNMVEPEHGYTALMLAIRLNSMNVVDLLLSNPDIDLEAHAANGDTAIMLAAFYGYLPLVKSLLARDVQINRPGWTALHYAAINGNPHIIKELLDASAYIDAESPDDKMTPLMLAAMRGRTGAVKLLTAEGADITLKNAAGLTALDLARKYKQADVIEEMTGAHTP